MSELKHGDHVCLVFSNTEEQLAGLVPFISQGLERGEQCLAVQHHHSVPPLLRALAKFGVDVAEERRRGALVLRNPKDVYLPHGVFEPEKIIELLDESVDDARKAGFSAFRATADMSWALAGKPGSDRLLKYEGAIHTFYKDKPAIGMCQYHKHQFPPSKVQRALISHSLTFLEEDEFPNYYQVRIRKNDLYADIVRSKNPVEAVQYYYVVQRDGSADVISWGRAPDLNSAKTEAEWKLQQHLHTESRVSLGYLRARSG